MAIFSLIYNICKTKILSPLICKHASFKIWQVGYDVTYIVKQDFWDMKQQGKRHTPINKIIEAILDKKFTL